MFNLNSPFPRHARGSSGYHLFLAVSAFLVSVFVLLFPLPGGIVYKISSLKTGLGISLGVIALAWLTRIRWLGLFAFYFMFQWWYFAMPGWSTGFILVFLVWLAWLLISQKIPTEKVKAVNWAFVLAGLVHVVFILLQVAEIDPVMKPITSAGTISMKLKQPIVGLFGNPSDVGLFLALSLPLVLMLDHASDVAIFFLYCLAIFFTKSTTALSVAFLVGFLFVCRSYGKHKISAGWILGALPLAAFSGVWFNFLDKISISSMRFDIWKQALSVWKASPWLGWGPYAVGSKWIFTKGTSKWAMLQNEWLELLFNHGAIGLAIVALIVLWTICRCIKYKVDFAICVGLFVVGASALFSIPFHLMPTAMLAAWYLGRAWSHQHEPV